MRKVLAFLARPFLKIPRLRRWYLRRLLTYLEDTPPSKLTPEMRTVQAMLKRLPRHKRLAALETGLREGQAQAEMPQSRALRRAAERETRRRR
jgi:hypothetical protein